LQVLQYAAVKQSEKQPLRLRAHHPSPSEVAADTPSGGGPALNSGDVVAIGGTCGQWSYVQRVGAREVSYGWVESSMLSPVTLLLPFDGGVPGAQDSQLFSKKWRIRVKLTKGRGIPVCEAYLQRLNQTFFYEAPFCGRPDNDQVPGFVRLNAVPLSSVEVNRLAVSIENVSFKPPANFIMKPDALVLAESATRAHKVYLDTRGVVQAVPRTEKTAVWRFSPEVDIDNDGTPDNVIMFSGFTWEPCGDPTEQFPLSGSEIPKPFVVSADGSSIDIGRTEALFGPPDVSSNRTHHNLLGYYPIGYSISLFKYRDKYFFDAFVGDPGSTDQSRQTIHVFQRTRRQLNEICRVENLDADWRLLQ